LDLLRPEDRPRDQLAAANCTTQGFCTVPAKAAVAL
jgi:hypothetical protein